MEFADIEVLETLEERVAPRHTALLVVDMQNDYCTPEGASDRNGRDLSAIRAAIPSVCTLIESARTVGIGIVFTRYTLGPGGAGLSGPEILRRGRNFAGVQSTIKGTWGHELIAELPYRPDQDLVIEKRRLSSFIGTDLDLILRARGVKTVVIAGVVTQGCVECTVRDAAGYDYYVAVAADCVASTEQRAHETSLACMTTVLRYPDAVTTSARLREIWAGGLSSSDLREGG
jgi:nicotinamidase-related amidase